MKKMFSSKYNWSRSIIDRITSSPNLLLQSLQSSYQNGQRWYNKQWDCWDNYSAVNSECAPSHPTPEWLEPCHSSRNIRKREESMSATFTDIGAEKYKSSLCKLANSHTKTTNLYWLPWWKVEQNKNVKIPTKSRLWKRKG